MNARQPCEIQPRLHCNWRVKTVCLTMFVSCVRFNPISEPLDDPGDAKHLEACRLHLPCVCPRFGQTCVCQQHHQASQYAVVTLNLTLDLTLPLTLRSVNPNPCNNPDVNLNGNPDSLMWALTRFWSHSSPVLISSLCALVYARSRSGGKFSWYSALTWSAVSQSRRPSGAAHGRKAVVRRRVCASAVCSLVGSPAKRLGAGQDLGQA